MITNNFNSAVWNITQNTIGAKDVPATVKLSADQKKEIEELAAWEGRKISAYIRQALDFYTEFNPDVTKPYDAFRDVRIVMMRHSKEIIKITEDRFYDDPY